MELKSGEDHAPARLKRIEGPDLHLETRMWLSTAETVRARIRGPGGQIVSAELLVRARELASDRLHIAALVTRMEGADLQALSQWIVAMQGGDLAPPPRPSAGPVFTTSPGQILVRWPSLETFSRAWARDLSQGFMPLPTSIELPDGQVRLRLATPDGQVFSLRAVYERRDGHLGLRVQLNPTLKRKLRRLAEQPKVN